MLGTRGMPVLDRIQHDTHQLVFAKSISCLLGNIERSQTGVHYQQYTVTITAKQGSVRNWNCGGRVYDDPIE